MWLRKLAAAEHERCGGPGVGVVGHVLHGGFALGHDGRRHRAGAGAEPALAAFPLSKKFKADIGISDADLARVKERTAAGACLLGLRFTNDPFCFEERFETLRRELGDAFIAVEIDSAPGNPHGHPKQAHSVLTEHLVDEEGTPTRAALDQTLAFFREKLGVGQARARGPRAWFRSPQVRTATAGSPRTRARPSARRRPWPRRKSTPSPCRPSAAARRVRAGGGRTG